MKKNYVSNSQESTRMFRSDLLESLSKVHFSVPLFVYIPVICFLLYKAFTAGQYSLFTLVLLSIGGLFVWTFTEYILHRFVFHFVPKQAWAQRIHFIFHGVHHDYPNDAKRLVMPPSASIPLATGFYLLFDWLLPDTYVYAFFTGFIGGYLVYDMTHYAIHHLTFKSAFWKKLKKHHAQHHYNNPDRGYGVSSDLWDKIFRSEFTNKSQTR